ncbi:hypothetical protein SCUCBS95973_003483 [Sporothrix curviconia]|uniref:C6 zinc finger domain containing protein n=1 Tax=Sporothrix curviconia TaxID=1260050 RepID=A0ABP0BFR9_9PEZI
MTSANPNTAAINISPPAASSGQMNHDMNMPAGSVGADAYSPPSGSYSPPTFTYTTAEGTTTETMAGTGGMNGMEGMAGSPSGSRDRRYSDEWDASKVPPSRFQKRKGSIYSTPGSRDGHVDNNYATKFHAKHAELGYNKAK